MIRSKNIIPFIVLLSCLIQNCHSPEEPSNIGLNGLKEIPVIKGIYVTTIDLNSATGYKIGKTLGEPSYFLDSSSIIVCPNPYNIHDNPWGGIFPKIAIYNLPPKCTIQIYKGISDIESRWQNESQKEGDTQIMGAIVNNPSDHSILPTITFEHTNGTGDEIWSLLDRDRKLVSSGFYRIYVIPESQRWGNIQWADAYIITDENWKDPTGWLSNTK